MRPGRLSKKISQAKLRDVILENLERLGELIYIHDLDGRLLSISDNALDILGYEQKEMLGKHVSDFISTDYDIVSNHMARPNERIWPFYFSLRRKDGTSIPGEARVRALNWKGERIGTQGFFRPGLVTGLNFVDRLARLYYLFEFSEMIKKSDEGIFVIDPDGKMSFSNRSLRLMLGIEAEKPEDPELLPQSKMFIREICDWQEKRNSVIESQFVINSCEGGDSHRYLRVTPQQADLKPHGLTDKESKPYSVVWGTVRDVTRIHLEERIREEFLQLSKGKLMTGECLHSIANIFRRLTSSPICEIWMLDHKGEKYVLQSFDAGTAKIQSVDPVNLVIDRSELWVQKAESGPVIMPTDPTLNMPLLLGKRFTSSNILAVPFADHIGEDQIGIIVSYPDQFVGLSDSPEGQGNREALVVFAKHMTMALKNSHHFEQSEILSQILRTGSLEFIFHEEYLKDLINKIKIICQVEACSIFLSDPDDHERSNLLCIASTALEGSLHSHVSVPKDMGFFKAAFQGSPVVIENEKELAKTPYSFREKTKAGIKSAVLYPIRISEEDEAYGVLRCANKLSIDRDTILLPFSEFDMIRIRSITSLLALVFSLSRAIESLARERHHHRHEIRTTVTSMNAGLSELLDIYGKTEIPIKDDLFKLKKSSDALQDWFETQAILASKGVYDARIDRDNSVVFGNVIIKPQIASFLEDKEDKKEVQEHQFVISGFSKIPRVYIDVGAMKKVVRNIFDNAYKYRNEDRPIRKFRIEISAGIDYAKGFIFRFKDWGVGIDPNEVEQIFDHGFTGKRTKGRQDSTGMGLYICRAILRAHGGSIKVTRNESPTEITLILPIMCSRPPVPKEE